MATNGEVFDSIATTWYGIRHWPLLPNEMAELAARWTRGRLINLGCGAGADFLPFEQTMGLVGLDCSRGMLSQASRHMKRHRLQASLVQGDLVNLPLADNSFDYATGVACYHHIRGVAARTQAFAELSRVLRPGGEAFISVWNHDQPRFVDMPQDCLVPWGRGKNALLRYYYLYTTDELGTTLTGCGFEILQLGAGTQRGQATVEDRRNICALVRKPASAAWSANRAELAEPG